MKQVLLLLCIAALFGCNKSEEPGEQIIGYKEYSMIVASKKLQGVVGVGSYFLSEVYAVNVLPAQKWQPLVALQDFDYEKGFEYVVKISETNYLDYRRGDPAWSVYKLLEVISKDKKDSEGLPEHFIPDWHQK